MTQTPSQNGPAPRRRLRLDGTLDMVQASDRSFRLLLEDGTTKLGRLVGRPITGLARLLGRRVILFGTVDEREDFEADGYIPNDGQAWVVSPDELPSSPEVREEMARRLRSVIGTWPGDETDEQIEQALREMR